MRALALGGADLVVVPQAGALDEWPEGLYEGEMRVAAFQHGYFVALCNRVGEEECLTFAGESFVCAPDGRVIARAPTLEDSLLAVDVDLAARPSRRTRGGCSCNIAGRSSMPSGRVRMADRARGGRDVSASFAACRLRSCLSRCWRWPPPAATRTS